MFLVIRFLDPQTGFLDLLDPRLVQCYGGKISILPSKDVKEMDQHAQERCHECQEVQESCLGIKETYY